MNPLSRNPGSAPIFVFHFVNIVDDDDDPHVWIGATDEVVEGQWMWYKIEQPVTYADWGPSEPNSNPLGEIEDCLVMWAGYQWEWADLNCDERAYFVCEKG